MQPGIALHDLRNAELPGAPPFVLDALLAESKEISVEGEIARLQGRKVSLRDDEQQARQAIERAFETAGLAAPSAAEALAKSGVESARARELMQILLRERKLVRINAELILHHIGCCSSARVARSAPRRPFSGTRLQGVDGRLAQVCHPSARIP